MLLQMYHEICNMHLGLLGSEEGGGVDLGLEEFLDTKCLPIINTVLILLK